MIGKYFFVVVVAVVGEGGGVRKTLKLWVIFLGRYDRIGKILHLLLLSVPRRIFSNLDNCDCLSSS